MSERDDVSFEPLAPLDANDEELAMPGNLRDGQALPPRAAGSGWKGKTAIFILLIGVAVLGVWISQLQKQLQGADETLSAYQENLARLEERLMVTDESMSQTSTQTEDKLSVLDSEVRKLWDNVWKRSKARFEAHEVRFDKLEADLASGLEDVRGGLKKQAVAISAVDKKIGAVKTTVATLAKQIDTANAGNAAIQADLKALDGRLAQLGEGITGASSDQELMIQRINELEDWVDSINQYRRQVNQRLTDIETRPPEAAPLQ